MLLMITICLRLCTISWLFFPNSCFSITNLKYWGHCEQILTRTLTLLSDLSISYNSVRKLVKLEEVQFMLNNHTVSKIVCKCARFFIYVVSSNLWICETDLILMHKRFKGQVTLPYFHNSAMSISCEWLWRLLSFEIMWKHLLWLEWLEQFTW